MVRCSTGPGSPALAPNSPLKSGGRPHSFKSGALDGQGEEKLTCEICPQDQDLGQPKGFLKTVDGVHRIRKKEKKSADHGQKAAGFEKSEIPADCQPGHDRDGQDVKQDGPAILAEASEQKQENQPGVSKKNDERS